MPKWTYQSAVVDAKDQTVAFVFDGYSLDPQRRELTFQSNVIAVGPQAFDLLLHLVENRDRVVTKDDLLHAVWAGRIVSESTVSSHINAVRKAIGDSGDEQRLVKTVPRKGFRFVGEIISPPPGEKAPIEATPSRAPMPDPGLALPDKPSIAVLPFHNLSNEPQQDYFADGIVEDVIAALSRSRWLFVVARNSSFAYKGRVTDVKEVGRELGVRYILEGSVRRSGARVRITGQLVDAATGANIWAERFEGSIADVFDLQDQITENVVGAIAPQLERAEIERAKRKPTENLQAYDHYLRGMAKLHTGTREALNEALPSFLKAIELDPEYASAYGMGAWCYFWRRVNGWTSDRVEETKEGIRLGRLAVELGRDDAVALTRGGHALAHLAGELDNGLALLDRAVLLNPNLAAAWFLGGYLRAFRGETEGAIDHFNHALRLSPLDLEMFRMQAGIALAHFFARRFDVASRWAEEALRSLPSFTVAVAVLAASDAHRGQIQNAAAAVQRLRVLDPLLRVSNLGEWLPIHRSEDAIAFADGLRSAGLPD